MKNDVLIVKELGEQIGYGHLMHIASSLWRESMRKNGYPISGAFVPTCMPFIKDEHVEMHVREANHYDKIIKE